MKMAEDTTLVLSILSFIRDSGKLIWNMMKGDCGYVTEYKENVKGLHIAAESLKSKAMDIQVLIDDAEMKGEKIKNEVQTWQKRVEEITAKKHKLEVELNQDKKWSCCCYWTCPDLNSRRNLSKQTTKLKKDFEKLLEQGQANFSDSVSLATQGPPTKFTPPPDFNMFASTKKAMEEVVRALENDEVDRVGVYGMGGVGKTYMVKQVGAQVQSMKIFDQVVLATVSQTPSVRKIQGEIADKLGLKLEEESESGRANKLRIRISRCTKILVILDDIWNRLDLSAVGIPTVDKKCKILLTTRRMHVCIDMDSKESISLNILSPDDSWTLFSSASGVGAQALDSRTEFSVVARAVVGECSGLPIALVVVGRALREKNIKVWEIARRRLEKSEDACEDGENDRVFKCIKLSYDFLSKDKGKPFFLMCCFFPEDHNIDKENLARYAMGLGLFPRVSTMVEARDETYALANHLKDSCLLLNGDNEKSLKMHDVIRDIAIRIASSEHAIMVQAGLGLKECPRPHSFDERCKAISLMSNEIKVLPDGLLCPLLQTLLLQANTNLSISNDFFASMKALKVLDLNHINIQSLPTSLKLSLNLRTLCLDGSCASDISILGEITSLEVLSLRKSKANELPVNIGKLVALRILDLTLSTCINIPPRALSGLSCLEELYMQGSFSQWSNETNASFDELLGLTRLKILKVDVQDAICLPRNVTTTPNWEYFNICISVSQFIRTMNAQLSKNEASDSRSLLLSSQIGDLPNWFNNVVSRKAQSLIYSECDVSLNIIEEYHQGKLTDLKFLYIGTAGEIIYLLEVLEGLPNEPILGNVEELYVHQMYKMTDLCSGELPHGSLQKLNFLEVKQCNEMGAVLLPYYLLQRLLNLERLHVSGNSVEVVFGSFDGLNQEGDALSLREMRLENLPKLTSIWKEPNHIPSYTNLKVVVVIQCEELRSIFPARVCKSLVQLEELWVENCMQLEVIICKDDLENNVRAGGEIVEENHVNEAVDEIVFPQLRTLSLRSLPNVTSFYSGNVSLKCPLLEKCGFHDCPNLMISNSDFHSNTQVLQVIDQMHLVPQVQGKFLGHN